MSKYQDVYPETPILRSSDHTGSRASDLLTLEYFEAEPATMPTQVFDQHHILINLNPKPHRVENWRAGEHRDFTYHQYEIVVTPAGIESGWKWHEKSKVIVVTLEPQKFEAFAQKEVGILLGGEQLTNIPQFEDEDLCRAAEFVYQALESRSLGFEVMFESLARVFLVKLIQRYGQTDEEELEFSRGFTSSQYKKVLEHVKENFANSITLEDLAATAAISTHHFSRLFKKTVGRTPMQFVQAHRIDEAKKMLADRELSLTDIALACGFADQAHFSKVFKQHLDLSPREFRQKSL